MKSLATHQTKTVSLPLLSSQNLGWNNILVEQFQYPSGECNIHYNDEHAICLSLAPRPVRFLQIKGGKSHTSLYGKGDMSITPAKMTFFARWDGEDNFMQIRIASRFIQPLQEKP